MFEGHSVFHESYYEHSCSILNEKDVLYTDIKKSWFADIKRWWYNWFLLSYNDERCRIYYTSSHAMRLERKRQFRRHRSRIHPLSKFSKLWNAFILTVVLTNRVIFHHNTTIMFMQLPPIFYFIGAALDGILLFDVFVINFKMGYIDEEARRVVLNAGRGRIHYASTKLFLYVISAMPLQAIMLLRYGMSIQCYRCKANRFVSVIKLLGFIGLYRVFDASTYWSRERGTFKATYFFKFLRICILGFIFMLQFLNASEAVSILIIIENNEIYEKSYLAIMMQQRYWYNPPSAITYYCIEFSIISKSVFLFGYGLRPKLYYVDALLGMISFVCANVFYVWGLVECYAVINRLKYSEDQMNIHRDRSMNLMRCRRLSNKISAKLDKYYDFNMIKLVLIEKQNDLYHFLPSAQRREIRLTSYGRFIKRIPYFSDWPPKIIDGIVLLLKQEVFLEHDIVADMWSQGEGLVIVQVGMMAVYSAEGEEMGHLIDGDYFGELTLVTNREIRTSAVIAITPCSVLFLSKNAFREYMKDFPELFLAMRRQLRDKYSGSGNITISSEKAQHMIGLMKEQMKQQHNSN